jgi:hypothetical protein
MKPAVGCKRARSNDGRTSVHQVLPVRNSLINAVLGAPVPMVRKALRLFNGPKPVHAGPPSAYSDEEVLEIRRMRHWHGMTVAQIAAKLDRPHGTVNGICEYRTRVHLDPGPRPEPGKAPTSRTC